VSGTKASPEIEYLGQFLYVQRKALRLTLDEVATGAGTSKSYLWEIEHGQASPSFMLVARLCQVLCLDIGGLAAGALKVAEVCGEVEPVQP
jgi:transcriptional regulator with XRE-family HTH domain